MNERPMNHDPQGYYGRLEVDWQARPAAIHAAYRRKARVLHPDIPVTGDAAAFVALKEAYDVLADPLRRAAYDRATRSLQQLRTAMDAGEEIRPDPPGPPPVFKTRGPRLSDLPLAVWAGLGILVLIAGTEVALHMTEAPPAVHAVNVPATAPTVPPEAPPPPPHPIRLIGTTNVYVIPTGGPALVLRHDRASNAYVPIGKLPPFSTAQALRVLRDNGLVEIRLTDTATGFIDASRLAPGNAEAARQAYCAYDAGPPPSNGEILGRSGVGAGQATIENQSGEPMVVRLRDPSGAASVTMFLDPGGSASVGGLPGGVFRPDFATGELWSRACTMFVAGMRAERFPAAVNLSQASTLIIPPDVPEAAAPRDISDQDFEHD